MAFNLKRYALAMFIAPNGEVESVWQYALPEEQELLNQDFAGASGEGFHVLVYENPQPTRECRPKKVEGTFIDAFGVERLASDGDPADR